MTSASAAGAAIPDLQWRLNPVVELRWRVWDDSCVAFEAVSGETAVVEPLDAAASTLFDQHPQSLTAVVDKLAADLAIPPSVELRQQVSDALEAFVARGWLEPVIATS